MGPHIHCHVYNWVWQTQKKRRSGGKAKSPKPREWKGFDWNPTTHFPVSLSSLSHKSISVFFTVTHRSLALRSALPYSFPHIFPMEFLFIFLAFLWVFVDLQPRLLKGIWVWWRIDCVAESAEAVGNGGKGRKRVFAEQQLGEIFNKISSGRFVCFVCLFVFVLFFLMISDGFLYWIIEMCYDRIMYLERLGSVWVMENLRVRMFGSTKCFEGEDGGKKMRKVKGKKKRRK